MRKLLDYLFAKYQWYRRWQGGTWYYIQVKLEMGCFFLWSRTPPCEGSLHEYMVWEEAYFK